MIFTIHRKARRASMGFFLQFACRKCIFCNFLFTRKFQLLTFFLLFNKIKRTLSEHISGHGDAQTNFGVLLQLYIDDFVFAWNPFFTWKKNTSIWNCFNPSVFFFGLIFYINFTFSNAPVVPKLFLLFIFSIKIERKKADFFLLERRLNYPWSLSTIYWSWVKKKTVTQK